MADGADAADARGDGRHFGEVPADHHRLEETGRLGHLPFDFLDRAVVDIDMDVAVAFDTGDMVHVDVQGCVAHCRTSGSSCIHGKHSA